MRPSNWFICQIASPVQLTSALICMVIISSLVGGKVEGLHLSGVTSTPDHPRADVLTSFFHELIAEIGELGNFTYNIRTLPGAKYGGAVGDTKPEGLIGEVYSKRADFVIADLEITEERKKFIEFTRPFMKSRLAALVRRDDTPPSTNQANGGSDRDNKDKSQSTDDNGQTTTATTGSGATLRALLQKSKRGVVRGSLTEQYFRTSKHPRVYHLLPSSVPTLQVGVQQVDHMTDFVLISDSARLNLIAAHDCQFKVVTPTEDDSIEIGNDFTVEYAIGFENESPFLNQFDAALEQLELSGKLQALIDQHWTDYCNPKSSNSEEETNGASSLAPLWWIGGFTILTIIRMLTSIGSY